MTLRAVLDTLDDVPEVIAAEYVERDGRFYLDVDESSLRSHTAVAGLSKTLADLKKEKEALKAKLDAANARLSQLPEDFDPATLPELREELERLKKDPQNRDGEEQLAQLRTRYEDRIKALEARNDAEHKKTVEKLNKQLADIDGELRRKLIDDALTSAIVESGVKRELTRAVKALLQPSITVVVDEDLGTRRAVVESDLGEVEVKKFVDEWARSEEGKPFVAQPTGGGAAGSDRRASGDNPFTAANWNVTRQGQIAAEDMAKAERLARAAGTTVGGGRPATGKAA